MFSDAIELVFTVGEEGLGNLYGMKHYMSSQTYIKEIIAVDLGYNTIAYDCVGSTRYQVSIKTNGGHSWGDFGNPNAIIIASSIINELTKLELCNAENSKTTYNVGVIEGGTTVNTIAEKCMFLFEYRSDNDYCLNTMNEKFKELLKKYRHASYKIIGERPSSKNINIEEQKNLVDKVSNIIENVTNEKPKLDKLSMDFNVAMNMGIPCTSIGVCDTTNAHSLEERINADSLLPGLEILIDLMLSYK